MNEVPRDPVTKDGELVQITKIGDALGFILSDEMIDHLNLGEGDKFRIFACGEGSMILASHDRDYAKTMEIARRSFIDYAETYKALAK